MKNTTAEFDFYAAAPLVGQVIGLQLLRAEMHALSQVLPGIYQNNHADSNRSDAMKEADFDNMPV